LRIVLVWITALMLMASITIGWYMSNTVVNTMASGSMDLIGTGQGLTLLNLLEYVNIAWGPVFDLIVLLWALTYPAERDAYSY
jgi:hypothetical protein